MATAATLLCERHLHARLRARRADDLDLLASKVDGRRLLAGDYREYVDAVEPAVDLGAEDLADLRTRWDERLDERATRLARARGAPRKATVVELARELDLDAARHAQKLAASLRSL